MNKLYLYIDLLKNMGMRYVFFRVFYMVKIKTGLIRQKSYTKAHEFINLEDWKINAPAFFFNSKEDLRKSLKADIEIPDLKILNERVTEIKNGIFTFFNSKKFELGKYYNWVTNPETGYNYSIENHWYQINDYSKDAGDIKYVWEKARFSWIYDIIRYDMYSDNDNSKFVLSEINDFIDKNPIDQGPNYKCSQEISIRTLNWIFALYFYKNSKYLDEILFGKILTHIYSQLSHVYFNINFSRIAVRNNHAITETLALYLSGLLFPFLPETKKWSETGKKWFEEEVQYQIYADGSYLQFSHNYHRVVVQLLSWAIILSKKHEKELSNFVYERAKKTLEFLYNHQDSETGFLPNYGMNDGALFFPLNQNHYRDYRPQMQALAHALDIELYDIKFEDTWWYFQGENLNKSESVLIRNNVFEYNKGGFYGIRDKECLTTIRCGSYKDRPAQADALNIDIWYKGKNIIFDPGTYMYNTKDEFLNFYHGSNGHNTLTIGEYDQMVKGERFIWYFWTKAFDRKIRETESTFEFEGKINAFRQLGKHIVHHRKIIKYKNILKWHIIDIIEGYKGNLPLVQHWNVFTEKEEFTKIPFNFSIRAFGKKGNALNKKYIKGWYSEKYGVMEEFRQILFKTKERFIETIIEIH